MKPLIIGLMALIASSQLMAGTFELSTYTKVYEGVGHRRLTNLATFRPGTRLVVEEHSYDSRRGMSLHRVIKIKRPGQFQSNHRRNVAFEVNDSSNYIDFFISSYDLNRATRVRRVNNNRPVLIDTQRNDRFGYDVCYENPRSRVVTINQRQKNRGKDRVIGGIFGAIAGQIIGGDVGDVISIIGAGFAVAGAIDLNQSSEVIFENSNNCRQYYQVDNRRYDFRNARGRRCTTTRFYTNRWGTTTEYFETTCNGNRYMTFNRHRSIWR